MIYPNPPNLVTPVLGNLPTFNNLTPVALDIPTFDGILPLEPASTVITTLPFVYAAYANVIQDDIDGKIADLATYSVPTTSLLDLWRLEKDKVLRKYHFARRDMLNAEGRNNHVAMPGHIRLKLSDMSIEERRDLADTLLKLTDGKVSLSLDTIDAAMKTGLESNAIRFDSHHRLQSANFEVASAAVDAGLKAASLRVQAYNKTLDAVSTQIHQTERQNEAKVKELEAYERQLQIPGIEAEVQTLLMNVYRATVEFEVEKARLDVIQYEVYIVALELERAMAQVEVARAELTLAQTNAVTAQYEIQKAQTRLVLADLERYRIQVDIAKAALEEELAHVNRAKMELNAAIDLAETGHEVQRNLLTTAKENLANAITTAEVAISEAETARSTVIANTVIADALQKVVDFHEENYWKHETTTGTANVSFAVLASGLAANEADYRTQLSLAANERTTAMLAAATNATNSTVTSDYYENNV